MNRSLGGRPAAAPSGDLTRRRNSQHDFPGRSVQLRRRDGDTLIERCAVLRAIVAGLVVNARMV
jgi:hypothetical protein